jgi:hypothetical protein
MVLQRDGARVWGLDGNPTEVITLSIDGQKAGSCTAGTDGKWVVNFSSGAAGWNHTVKVAGSSGRATVLTNVAFGDVILCSGQSNMELETGDAVTPAQASNIRVMRLDHFSSPNRTVDTVTWGHAWDGTGSSSFLLAFGVAEAEEGSKVA